MTNEEAIKYLKQIYPVGGHCWLDEQRIKAVDMAIEALTKASEEKEPVSEELDKFAIQSANKFYPPQYEMADDNWKQRAEYVKGCKDGAVWRQGGLWKDAQGDDLPDIDREVIVLAQVLPKDKSSLKVCFGHRPNPKGWDGKDFFTGKIHHHNVQTYGKGGWNQPNVVYWLDLNLPKNYDGDET